MSAPRIIDPAGGGTVTGTGTPGTLAKFTGTGTSIGDSGISDDGATVSFVARDLASTASSTTWTLGNPNSFALIVKSNSGPQRTLVLDTLSRAVGVGGAPGTLLHVQDNAGYPFAGSTYEGVRLQRSSEAIFSASDYTLSFRAGLTGATAVVGTSTAHDLLLQRGNVTALTLGASGAVTFAGNLTSSAAQTWTLAAGSTSALNIASNLLNLDTTNSRVGIGTASPGRKLVVNDAAAECFLSIKGVVGGSSGLLIGDPTTEVLGVVRAFTSGPGIYLGAGNNQHLSINATGNVGIGTASPAQKLHVYVASGNDGIRIETGTNTASDYAVLRFTQGGGEKAVLYTNLTQTILKASAGTLDLWGSGSSGARIDSSGNVGIGTVSPGFRLDVVGAPSATAARLQVSNSNTAPALNAEPGLNLKNTTNANGVYTSITNRDSVDNPNTQINFINVNQTGSGAINFVTRDSATGFAERARIDSSGNLILNTANTGATIQAAGTSQGLKLPATPGNTDPNTLDCYADGGTANSGGVTWTPTLKFGGNTTGIVYNSQVGRYTRIGNMVFATCYVRLTSKGSATGAAAIDGLPTSANLAGLYAAGTIGFISYITSTGTTQAYITPNSSQITLRQADIAGTNAATTDVNFANTSEIIISIAYSVN